MVTADHQSASLKPCILVFLGLGKLYFFSAHHTMVPEISSTNNKDPIKRTKLIKIGFQ